MVFLRFCRDLTSIKPSHLNQQCYYAFDNYEAALEYAEENSGTENPLALIFQEEYISELEPGEFIHIKEERITEWPIEFLNRPKRFIDTIPKF